MNILRNISIGVNILLVIVCIVLVMMFKQSIEVINDNSDFIVKQRYTIDKYDETVDLYIESVGLYEVALNECNKNVAVLSNGYDELYNYSLEMNDKYLKVYNGYCGGVDTEGNLVDASNIGYDYTMKLFD